MKFTTTFLIAGAIAASGQGLYNVSNLYALDEESSPIQYQLSVFGGYDDNFTPIGSEFPGAEEEGSGFVGASIRAAFAHNESNYSLSVYANVGAIYYFDAVDPVDDVSPEVGFGANLTYRFNDRVRFTSNNYTNYGFEPDFSRGIANDRRSDLFIAWQSNNSIGIRWSERFGTVHGVGFSGVEYDGDIDGFSSISIFNQARYRVSPRTILTAGYTFAFNTNDNSIDSDSDRYTLGLEHSLTDRTGFSIRGGVRSLDRDNGVSQDSFFLNASLRHQVTSQFKIEGFVNYDLDDFFVNNIVINQQESANFDARENLRIGLRGSYTVSEKVSLHGGLSLVNTEFINGQSNLNGNIGDNDATVYNLNAGFSYGITNSLSLVGNYNFTNSSSDEFEAFEYNRNRYNLGITASF